MPDTTAISLKQALTLTLEHLYKRRDGIDRQVAEYRDIIAMRGGQDGGSHKGWIIQQCDILIAIGLLEFELHDLRSVTTQEVQEVIPDGDT